MSESGSCTSIINLSYQDGSEGSPSNPAKFNNQDYAQLKDNCLRRGRLFVDSTFPPDNQSLGDLPDLASWQESQVEWLRPSEILKAQNNNSEPSFFSKGASRFDFGQGNVGNCWFLAAISSLTFNKGLLVQVVPMDQSFNNYAGIFHFRFWRFGKWVDVIIDDHLPTLNKQLLSVRSKGGNEFWAPLLEKAYAKMCGSYADMNAGLPSEACKDFSGGVHMSYQLRDVHSANHDNELWQSLKRATGCKSMVCCGTAPKGGELVNTVAHTGLVDAHAYSITAVTEVNYYGSKVKLVRIMNPWGKTGVERKVESDLWNKVTPEDREKCFDRDDGEFWMELEDFCYYFNMLSICCENPNFIYGDLDCQWKCMIYEGSWVAGRSAGGNVNNYSFATNPQYRIQVTKTEQDKAGDKNILISLMQKPKQRRRKETRSYPIGVTVFEVPAGTQKGRLGSSFFNRSRPVKQSQFYTSDRDLIEQHSLQPGEYVIVPSTMKPYMSADPRDGHDDDDHDHDHDHEHEEETLILPEIPTDEGTDKEDHTDKDPIREMFNRYANQSDELSARQLQKLLNDNFPHGTWRGFGLDTCRSMIAIVDSDQRMKMTLSEFTTLWEKIDNYKKLFHRYDVSQNGTLSEYELNKAIEGAGMDASNGLVTLMMFRYSGFSSTSLEEFIALMLNLEKTSNVFKDKSSDGVIRLSWQEWSNFSLY